MAIRINNLKSEQCVQIYPIIAGNGWNLCKISGYAAKGKNYGCATSLLILGAEEYAKAIIVLLHANHINIFKIPEACKVFRDHKAKHEIASASEMLYLLAPIIELIENLNAVSLNSISSFLNSIANIITGFLPGIKKAEEVFGNMEWWGNADIIKQNGFYVNFNDTLLTPGDISNSDYNRALKIVQRLRKSYQFLLIFSKRYNNEFGEMVNTINFGITVYLNNSKNELKSLP